MISMLIGSALLIWVVYDLFTGTVYLHRAFHFKEEPWSYWSVMLLWLTIALSFFIWTDW